jgi:hypothetical protein
METVCFSETLVSTYESTRRNNPEEQHRQVLICFSFSLLMSIATRQTWLLEENKVLNDNV